jgi:cytosine/uracil/thiamine/allantoin permease
VFSSSFHNLLSDFADVVICWIGPWMAIMVVDWLLRGRRYVPSELQRTSRGGLYWRSGGIHWPALIAQAVGTVLAVLSISQSAIPYYGVIAQHLGAKGSAPDFSIFFGIGSAAIVYLVLAGRSVRREGAKQTEMLAAEH